MLATDKLGDLNVCGLSAIDACLRQWISVRRMPKDVGCYNRCWLLPLTCLCSVLGDNTISISKDGIAQLGPMVRSQVRVLMGADLIKAYRP